MPEDKKPYHTLDISGLYYPILGSALHGALWLSLDLKSDLSVRIYSSGFFDLDELQAFIARFNNEKDKLEITEDELLLIYSCHYVQALFACDKENFFAWFLRNEKDEDKIKDSEDFRKVMEDGQKAMVRFIERSTLWNERFDKRKLQLNSHIRPLSL